MALCPDLNSNDTAQIAVWLRAIKPGSGDIINDLCVTHNVDHTFLVEKTKRRVNSFEAARILAAKMPKRAALSTEIDGARAGIIEALGGMLSTERSAS